MYCPDFKNSGTFSITKASGLSQPTTLKYSSHSRLSLAWWSVGDILPRGENPWHGGPPITKCTFKFLRDSYLTLPDRDHLPPQATQLLPDSLIPVSVAGDLPEPECPTRTRN